ncbi:unnamed protein product [Sphagnum jensenii]
MKAGGLSSHAVPQIGSSHPHPCAVTSQSLAPDSGMPSNDPVASLLGAEFDHSVNFAVKKNESNCKQSVSAAKEQAARTAVTGSIITLKNIRISVCAWSPEKTTITRQQANS